MKIPFYQVNAFTGEGFKGNPAGVCLLDKWLSDDTMQYIAFENQLSETAFIIKEQDQYKIRWFTPAVEVDLCGHATLASAAVIMQFIDNSLEQVQFDSKSGILLVRSSGAEYTMNFPADKISEIVLNDYYLDAFSVTPHSSYKGKTDYLIVFNNEKQIREMKPDFKILGEIKARGVIVTAPGDKVDFVSRFFAPQAGIQEDPVTGSAHTTLTPYWSGRLNKNKLFAWQLSERGGILTCAMLNDRVEITGATEIYIEGFLNV